MLTLMDGHGLDLASYSTGGSWQMKCVAATRGNQSRLGCIVIAILRQWPKHAPRIRGTAVISAEGLVIADMQLRPDRPFLATPLGTAEEIRDNLRGLADYLKLDDADRVALIDEYRKWIWKDFRPRADGPVTLQ